MPPKEDLRLCYEASPTGFVAARRLIQLGYDVIIVAPSTINRVERLADQLENLLLTWERAPWVLALTAMRGFQMVAAMTIISELGDCGKRME